MRHSDYPAKRPTTIAIDDAPLHRDGVCSLRRADGGDRPAVPQTTAHAGRARTGFRVLFGFSPAIIPTVQHRIVSDRDSAAGIGERNRLTIVTPAGRQSISLCPFFKIVIPGASHSAGARAISDGPPGAAALDILPVLVALATLVFFPLPFFPIAFLQTPAVFRQT